MSERRLTAVLAAIAAQPAGALPDRLCAAAAVTLDAPGVGVMLGADDVVLQTVCATVEGRRYEELQTDLGEGPSWSAHRTGAPVSAGDLDHDGTWPAFGPAAAGLGIRAVFAFPLRSGSAHVGALTLYRLVAGELDDVEHTDALLFARVALDLLLAARSELPSDDLDGLFFADTRDAEIHQASGMVSVQLGVAVAVAMSVLRAHAFSAERPMRAIAADIVARRLRLGDDADPVHPTERPTTP